MKQFLLFMMALLPVTASADKSGKCGPNLTWNYVEATKTLTVSGKGDMNSSDFALWGDISGLIENVIIEEGVTSIGRNAFRSCNKIKTLQLGNSITLIRDKAFTGCSALSSVIIPNSVTIIDIWAFSNCSSLKTLSIGNGVTSIGRGAFKGCTDLETLEIGDCNASIGIEAFGECSSLTALVIPDKVTYKGEYNQEIKGETNVEIIPVIA